MTAPVFVADPGLLDAVAVGDVVSVAGPEARHAVTVTRLAAGAAITLVDGDGRRVTGVIDTVDGSTALSVRVVGVVHEPVPTPWITVVQALPKGDRGELAVELLTEVGVDEIVPWSAANCVAVWKGDRADRSHRRWRDAARAAGKQSRRARFPVVAPLATTGDVVARIESLTATSSAQAVVLHESAESPLCAVDPESSTLLFIVGPEGGLTDVELAAFTHAGASTARLGPTVLRTSSAGMAAVAAVMASSTRWTSIPSEPA